MEGLTNRKLTESLCRALKDQTESSKETLRIGVCWKVRCAWDTLKSAGLQYAGTMLILFQSTHSACLRCFFSAETQCCRLLLLLVSLDAEGSVRCHVPCFHGWVDSKLLACSNL